MNTPRTESSRDLARAFALSLSIVSLAVAVETGDFDGDGRLSIADEFWLQDGGAPAPGSLEGFAANPCDGDLLRRYATILESYRRNVDDPMPHFYDFWPPDVRNTPLPPSSDAVLELESATAAGGNDDRVRIGMTLTLRASARGFVLYLEGEGDALRVPLWRKEFEGTDRTDFNERRTLDDRSWWDIGAWFGRHRLGEFRHPFGDLPVAVTHPAYLATRGRIVMTYGIRDVNGSVFLEHVDLAPGVYRIEIEARLRRGASAGEYAMRILEGSEVAFLDGSLAAPTIPDSATLTIEKTVATGWDGGVPQLAFDLENRRVVGETAMRLVRSDGSVPGADEPLVEARAGEDFRVRVQFRSDVPLNHIAANLEFRNGSIDCTAGSELLFTDPESGARYRDGSPGCGTLGLGYPGRLRASFTLAGGGNYDRPIYGWRPLEHFRPSPAGEWADLAEFALSVPADASADDELPILFKSEHGGEGDPSYVPEYRPYGPDLFCDPIDGGDYSPNWRYDPVEYTDGFVRVLSGGDPPPPAPEFGIAIELGDVTGGPGDLVAVPIVASSDVSLATLRLVLTFDPEVAHVEALELDVVGALSGDFTATTLPGEVNGLEDPACRSLSQFDPRREICASNPSRPFWVIYHETASEIAFIDIVDPAITGESIELGRLLLRIAGSPTAMQTRIDATTTLFGDGGLAVIAENGGEVRDADGELEFGRARSFRESIVTVEDGARFRRGDANADGLVDVSDPVATLHFLFTGGDMSCADAADADDSGVLEITDAIFELGVLFLGDAAFPEPRAECGIDETADRLGCAIPASCLVEDE